MASAQDVETSMANNNPSQDSNLPLGLNQFLTENLFFEFECIMNYIRFHKLEIAYCMFSFLFSWETSLRTNMVHKMSQI